VVLPLTNNSAKTSAGEDLEKICPAIAQQLRRNVDKNKIKNTTERDRTRRKT